MPDPTGIVSHVPSFHRGVAWKEPVRVATTANVTIATALNAGDTIDGVTLAAGNRVLVKDQSTASQNGIYVAGASPARAYDMDQDGTTSVPAEEIAGAFVYVIAGTANAGTLWHTTNTAGGTLGSTSIVWEEWSSGAEAGAGSYFSRRLSGGHNSNVTDAINSSSYVDYFVTEFAHDWDEFPATHFKISVRACSNASGQSILLQLTPFGSPTNPVSASGDDITIPFNAGSVGFVDSGWIAVSDAMAGIDDLELAVKGTNATVDLTYRWIEIAFKID